ncbi:MAG: carboxypeptidase-like regulatory domain-containing protein [Candidatus Eisenbacteria bacterium]|uniref:Carboxypeptidase-like regulatory domain-containing protein n=1 Tax=Eiseniibacteriota bacterium TaxID=2212470 RepID=A0A948W5G2_UNCEI|nr:carboxypeptidase-like regulatory domain-containing protein [Candidatus Eisenbacteria bacterium]MBU1948596.1 carboxypeptidase-like regulatory domain-containing protein [Candidatus Eisenbacteria bacterium]MBU2693277.1 carboxypeptidase-like regulatory domain-containing protein [Candidatus Eisenbacteria bacterium]
MRYPFLVSVLIVLIFSILGGCGDDDCPTNSLPGQEKIVGTVMTTSGPVAQAHIHAALAQAGAPGDYISASAGTDEMGHYSLPVPPGSYKLSVSYDGSHRFWYSDTGPKVSSDFADTIKIAAGSYSTTADFIFGAIKYTLQFPQELEGESLRFYAESAQEGLLLVNQYSAPQLGERVITFDFVPPGRYIIRVYVGDCGSACRNLFWLPATIDRAMADEIQVDPLELSSREGVIPPACHLKGAVDPRWSELLEGQSRFQLKAYGPDSALIAQQYVDNDSRFDIPIFAEGRVRLKTILLDYPHWVGGDNFFEADEYILISGASVPVDSITIGGILFHVVENETLCINTFKYVLVDHAGNSIVSGGNYQHTPTLLQSLAPGDYRLFIYWSFPSLWRAQWYDQANSGEEATSIVLDSEGDIENINVTLEKGGAVSGRILDSSGMPADGSSMIVRVLDTGWVFRYYWETADDGSYHLEGLPDGRLIIGIEHRPPEYARITWYPGTDDENAAEFITLNHAEEITGIDFQRLPPEVPMSPVRATGGD